MLRRFLLSIATLLPPDAGGGRRPSRFGAHHAGHFGDRDQGSYRLPRVAASQTRALMLGCALMAGGAQAEGRPVVVVELFTSQGCSSCPPAEALLLDIAKQPHVLALAFHVDYWDRLGWTDPYSSPEATSDSMTTPATWANPASIRRRSWLTGARVWSARIASRFLRR